MTAGCSHLITSLVVPLSCISRAKDDQCFFLAGAAFFAVALAGAGFFAAAFAAGLTAGLAAGVFTGAFLFAASLDCFDTGFFAGGAIVFFAGGEAFDLTAVFAGLPCEACLSSVEACLSGLAFAAFACSCSSTLGAGLAADFAGAATGAGSAADVKAFSAFFARNLSGFLYLCRSRCIVVAVIVRICIKFSIVTVLRRRFLVGLLGSAATANCNLAVAAPAENMALGRHGCLRRSSACRQ